MRLKNIILLIIALLIISCGSKNNGDAEVVNGVKIFKNGNSPSDRNLTVKAEFLFNLNEDTGDTSEVIRTITAIKTDDNGNIYVLDRRKSKVFKFDQNGNFLKSFGQQGNGPGELMRPMELLSVKDTLYIVDQRLRKILTFNREGEYLKDIIPLRDNGLPQSLLSLTDGNFAGSMFNMSGGGRGPGPRKMTYSLSVLDNKFEKINDMLSEKFEMDFHSFNPLDHLSKYTAGGGKIYMAENTEDRIQVNVFDESGKKIEEIKKSYAKTIYSESEKKYLKKYLETQFRRRDDIDMEKFRYKKAIENIFYHKDGYLLLESSGKKEESDQFNFILNIFKDGIYLNTVDLNKNDPEFYLNQDGFEKFLIGDQLFVYNMDDNIISVYTLKIVNKI